MIDRNRVQGQLIKSHSAGEAASERQQVQTGQENRGMHALGMQEPVESTNTCFLAQCKEVRYLSNKVLFVLRRHGRGTKGRQGPIKEGTESVSLKIYRVQSPRLVQEVAFGFLP